MRFPPCCLPLGLTKHILSNSGFVLIWKHPSYIEEPKTENDTLYADEKRGGITSACLATVLLAQPNTQLAVSAAEALAGNIFHELPARILQVLHSLCCFLASQSWPVLPCGAVLFQIQDLALVFEIHWFSAAHFFSLLRASERQPGIQNVHCPQPLHSQLWPAEGLFCSILFY